MSKQQYASMDPETFSTGGGLFDDLDVVFNGARFTTDPPSDDYQVEGSPIFAVVEFTPDGAEESVSQHFSCGAKAGDNFSISEDGFGLIPNGPNSKLKKSCKWGTFLDAAKTAGFPLNTMSGEQGINAIAGTRAHVNQIPDAERTGIQKSAKQQKYPPTTLCITKIHSLPGEVKKSAGKSAPQASAKGASKPAAVKAAAAGPSEDDIQVAERTLAAILVAKEGSIQKSQIALAAARELAKHPRRQEVTKLTYDLNFLARETFWQWDPTSNPQVVVGDVELAQAVLDAELAAA